MKGLDRYLIFIDWCDSNTYYPDLEICEKHHIIPKCMGGSDYKDNIILLSYKHHVIAHRLLYRSYPECASLAYAYCSVQTLTPKLKPVDVNLEMLQEAKEARIEKLRERMLGNKYCLGFRHSLQTKAKHSKNTKGDKNPCYDHTKYLFSNNKGGEEICTSFELKEKYGLYNQHLRKVVKGSKFRTGGWSASCLINNYD